MTPESWVNFLSFLSFTLSRLVSRNLGRWVWAHTLKVYNVFAKTSRGPWLRGDCLGPAGVINCIPVSALSSWVSLLPKTCGYNTKGYQSCIFTSRTDTDAKFQYFGLLVWRVDSLEETLLLGKIDGRRRRWRQRMRWLFGITDSMGKVSASSGRWWRTGTPVELKSMGLQKVEYYCATEQQLTSVYDYWKIHSYVCWKQNVIL